MALLDLLLLVFAMVMARAVSRVMGGVMEGLSGRAPRSEGGNAPARGVQMVRDPVCGTYVIPDRAVTLSDGSGRVFFCSANCRDKYRARPSASGSPGATSRDESVEGRTA
jgi:YHS domain-containing protein